MDRHTPKKSWLKAIVRAESIPNSPERARVRLRPTRSASMPLGTSQRKLTTWNTPSAMPTWAKENPRARRNTTHTPSATRKDTRKL